MLADILPLVADDFAAVDYLFRRELSSDVALVEEIGRYIVESGGKRLRPLLVLLATRCLTHTEPGTGPHIRLAAVIEFLHTATLLHDDVVDKSSLRRGRATANATWGNAPSVLVGDFLYSRAFQLMVSLGQLDVMRVLSDATNTIAAGEVQQLANIGNLKLTEPAYREVIRAKTALLFEAATHTAALLAGATGGATEALRRYGLHFGLAYQLMDDWLDYAGSSTDMGKNVGDDLAEGKLTLPLIIALRQVSPPDAARLKSAIEARSATELPIVLDIVTRSGALDATRQAVLAETEQARRALTQLPDTPYRAALDRLARAATARVG
ncbi:MAG: polyprenyl synthetase family protein [Pseudomonadales bacterium]